jgi:hypothetical protein
VSPDVVANRDAMIIQVQPNAPNARTTPDHADGDKDQVSDRQNGAVVEPLSMYHGTYRNEASAERQKAHEQTKRSVGDCGQAPRVLRGHSTV